MTTFSVESCKNEALENPSIRLGLTRRCKLFNGCKIIINFVPRYNSCSNHYNYDVIGKLKTYYDLLDLFFFNDCTH